MSTFLQKKELKAKNRAKSYNNRTDKQTNRNKDKQTDIENYNIDFRFLNGTIDFMDFYKRLNRGGDSIMDINLPLAFSCIFSI